MPLAIGLGLTLPLLLTSRVHVGRLLPALPLALLLVAAGAWVVAGWIDTLARRAGAAGAARLVAIVLAGAMLLLRGERGGGRNGDEPVADTRTSHGGGDGRLAGGRE